MVPSGVLWTVALLSGIAILLPAALFRLFSPRIREQVSDDPARAEPPPGDADAEKRFRQFRALGFRPFGQTRESCWFMSPIKPYWRSLEGERWLASEDRRTFVSFHRLAHREPVRFGVVSYLEGGGVVRATCPGAGRRSVADETHAYWRTEYRRVEPEQLLHRQQQEVAMVLRERGLAPRAMTMREIADSESFHTQRILRELGASLDPLIALYFLAPAILSMLVAGPLLALRDPAPIAICIGAAVFGVIRLVVIPMLRRRAIARSQAGEPDFR